MASLRNLVSAFGWVGVVVAPFVGWVWVNFRVFFPKPGASEEAEKHRANDLECRRRWIQASHFEQRYLGLLGGMLDWTTHRLIRDAKSIGTSATIPKAASRRVRLFGLDPFTEGSYQLCLRLAVAYPILVHFFLVGFAAVLLLPDSWRQWILAGWDQYGDARRVAFGWISLAPILALAGPALLLWGLYELLTAWGGVVGQGLLARVHGIALVVDPSTIAPLP
ncbi:MAG: hypothetical protein LGR52_10460 [Candidatus Thiosymbion ectosymbiont of Robbea hypermnestra]|nr:hypothetical protein [Candidatus Thiosymbion ectosymbiont of Robbea hypermnestra]